MASIIQRPMQIIGTDRSALTPAPTAERKSDFFRSSAWLMFAVFASGALMWLVHFLNKFLPKAEYGTLGTLMTAIILVPTLPLQRVFARQTAVAIARNRQKELAGMLRLALAGAFGVWLIGCLVVVSLQNVIIARWHIANPVALWVTLAAILPAFLAPLFAGVLQGGQRFKCLGWVMILQGLGRVVAASFFVIVLGTMADGVMAGVLFGCLAGLGLAMWLTREFWCIRPAPFDRRQFMRQVVPLVVGFACFQFLFSSDTIFVNAFFNREETAYYFTAGTLSRALVWTVGPLVAVMFPKIVHSAVRAEKTNLLGVTLLGTGLLVAMGAVGLWLLGPFVIRLVYNPSYVAPTLQILPWYAGAMVPLCLCAVVVNNLLAKSDFRIVPWLVALAAGYAVALINYHPNVVVVLQILGGSCVLMFLVCAWFTWL
ncbi:MAG TPA: hypothetical protein VKA67_05755, partial [Verrucomicrobiae bacterium]|nr:hypothetical protein [Verrucomicrobiae bacterium]